MCTSVEESTRINASSSTSKVVTMQKYELESSSEKCCWRVSLRLRVAWERHAICGYNIELLQGPIAIIDKLPNGSHHLRFPSHITSIQLRHMQAMQMRVVALIQYSFCNESLHMCLLIELH